MEDNDTPVDTYYYLGGRLIAMKESSANVTYVHQDHLTGTSVTSDNSGALLNTISYMAFGSTRSGSMPTDRLFTGQRLDETGLYYYNARYYDPEIGRFISADTFVQRADGTDSVSHQLAVNMIRLGLGSAHSPQAVYPQAALSVPLNPQALNRYAYVTNNPLKYTDPTGEFPWLVFIFEAVLPVIGVLIGVLQCSRPIVDQMRDPIPPSPEPPYPAEPPSTTQTGPPMSSDKMTPTLPLEPTPDLSNIKPAGPTIRAADPSTYPPGTPTIAPYESSSSSSKEDSPKPYTPEQFQQLLEYLDALGYLGMLGIY